MEEIKAPKKERKFLKAMGDIALTLFRELVLGIGKKVINKVGNKRQGFVIAFVLVAGISYASIDSIPYPVTGNKQRLGWQTSGNGLVYRGRSNDTITKPSSYVDKNVKAYLLLDSVRGTIFVWRQTYWDSILVGGGAFAQPVDSLFFDTSVPSNDVDTAKMRWDSELGTVALGMYDQVPNELGFKNFWLVKNQTGSTITKGSIVYANGTVGASGRITVAKFIANGSIESKYVLGITAHDLTDGEDGYVISFGKIRQVNTDTFAAGAILYPSPTVAGVWTDVEPVAPNIDMPIGFCINSSANNGTIAIRVASGYKLSELHDVAITSPVENSSLYYKGGLWRDTTAALLVSDTASMLANYSLKSYVDSIAQNFQDSIDEITNGYFKQEFPTVTKDTLNWTKPVQLPVGGSNLLLVYRNGQMINDAQYSVIDTNKVKINSGSYKLGENYTVVYVKGGGGSGGGGTTFDTSILNLQSRLNLKLNLSDTASMLANYATKAYADTTGRLYARQDYTTGVTSSTLTWTQSDTLIPGGVNVVQVYRNGQILLPSQYTIPTSTSLVIAASSFKVNDNYTVIFPRGGGAGSGGGSGSLTSISGGTGITVSPNPITTTGTVSADLSVLMELNDTSLLNLTTRFASKLNTTDTASLSNRINAKGNGTVTSVATGYGLSGGTITTTGTLVLDSAVVFSRIRDSIVDVAIGNDTIKILKQEYAPATTSVLTWTITPKFPIQLKQYILVFRNGQLLINDQYNLTDTNKITIVSNSFKVGANYTVVTVSGIGSVGTGAFPNPIYPDAGIALSTGTTWASSIPNNSSNWNTAFTDRLKWDGGSTGLTPSTGRTSLGGTTIGQSMFTLTNPSTISFPRFNADNSISALNAASFRSAIGAGTVTEVNVSTTAGNPISITNKTTTPIIELLSATSARNGYLTSTDWTTFNGKQAALTFTTPLINTSNTITINQASGSANGFITSTDWTTFNNKFAFSDTTILNLTSRFASKQNTLVSGSDIKTLNGTTLLGSGNLAVGTLVANDTLSLSNRINLKLNPSDTVSLSNRINLKFNIADTTQLNLTSRFAAKQNNILLTTTGTSGAATFNGTTLNIPNYTSSGGGTGTVTSVGLTAPSIFTVSGSPVTTSGTLALTYSGTALPLANGGTGATTPDGALTNFGASAMGKSLFGLTNSVSDKFIKVNTNNTITLLNAADTRTAIGATIRGANNFTLPDIGSISFLRYNADNSITQLNAADFRTAITAVSAVTASGPLASTGGLTPNISIGEASSTTTGIVNVQAQSFAGLKTFVNGIVTPTISLNYSTARTTNAGLSTYTVQGNDNFIIFNRFGTVTLTLPNAATFSGRLIYLKTVQGNVISNSANVVPLIGGSPGQAILDATAGKWCTLLSDGTYWNIMQAN